MKNFYYISVALPNNILGGSDLAALNLLKKLKKKFSITAISLNNNYCNKYQKKSIHHLLRKEKIKFIEFNKNINFNKKPLTIKNFLNTNYINNQSINYARNFLENLKFKKNDIIFCFGSAAISACSNIKCTKIALLEDVQDQVFLFREKFLINKLNFLKKIIKIFMLKIHFRGYYSWIKGITKNFDIKYTFSHFDIQKLKKVVDLSILPIPMEDYINKKKIKKKKFFNISMMSGSLSQDFKGIMLLHNYLLPALKKKNLLKNCKINLVMRIPKYIPEHMKKIIYNKDLELKKFDRNIVKSTDLLFYPSKYPVGVRSKILFSFQNSILVATSSTIKKCIPELEDFKNCIMSDNINVLIQKILKVIKKPHKFQYMVSNSHLVAKKYSSNLASRNIIKDLKKLNNLKKD